MPSWKKLITSGSDAAIPSISTIADFTIDAGGDIVLDADGTDIVLKDGGTEFGSFKRASSDFIIKSATNNKDIVFKGEDNSSTITALTLDMSDGGNAVLGGNISGSAASTGSFGSVHTAGNVGIGTTTSDATLTVQGASNSVKFKSSNGESRFNFFTGGGSDAGSVDVYDADGNVDMRLSTGGDSWLGLNGNVGINTTSPSVKLEVAGDISGSTIRASGDVIAFNSSDERYKDNIQPISSPLSKVNKIGGYEFDWNDKQDVYEGHDIGVIAQEVQKVLPEVVGEKSDGYLGVKYEKIVPLLIESIKDLSKKTKKLEREIKRLKHKK